MQACLAESPVCLGASRDAVEQSESVRFGFGGEQEGRALYAVPAVGVQECGFYGFRDNDADGDVGCTVEKSHLCGDHIRDRYGHGHPASVMPSCSGYCGRSKPTEVDRRMRLLHGLGPAVGCIEIDVVPHETRLPRWPIVPSSRPASRRAACRASWRQHRDRRLLRSSIPGPDRAATCPSITDRRWQPLSPCESRPVAAGEALRAQSRVWMSQERPLTVRRMGRTTGSTRAATRRPLGMAWPDSSARANVQQPSVSQIRGLPMLLRVRAGVCLHR